jgi:hypothetical protein
VSSYDGQLVRKFNTSGLDQGNFVSSNLGAPTNIWFQANGDLMVSDYNVGAVRAFASNGAYKGDYIVGLTEPEGVAFLPNGNLLLGNGGTGSVEMFSPLGFYLGALTTSHSGGLIRPNAIVVRQDPDWKFEINAGLNDAWYDPTTVGQGFLVTVFPDLEQMFVAWFTFDTERPPAGVTAQLGDPGHRWLTAQGPYDGRVASMTLYETVGGVFDSPQPPVTTDPEGYGTLEIEFSDCAKGVVHYEIPSLGLTGNIPIRRTAPDNEALCEALSNP